MSREAVMMFAGGWSVGGSMRVVHSPPESRFFWKDPSLSLCKTDRGLDVH